MKILKRIIIITALFTVVFIIPGIIISLTYEDTAINYLKKYLDKHLITEITVDRINFSLLKNFPNASVEFKNIHARSTLNFSAKDFTGKDTETLLTAGTIFFEFGLLKLLSGNFILRNIHIKNAKLIALTDKSGKCNYNIWAQDDKESSSSFSVDLQSLVFTNLEFEIINLKDNYSLDVCSDRINLFGNFSNTIKSITAKGDFDIRNLKVNNRDLVLDKECSIESDLEYSETNFRIETGRIKYNNIVFNISGDYLKGNPPLVNLSISSGKAPIVKLLPLFPEKLKTFREKFTLTANVVFRTEIAGKLSPAYTPDISTVFTISNGSVINKKTRGKLQGIKLSGFYKNGKDKNAASSLIGIKEFSTSGRNTNLKGNLNLRNFITPQIKLQLYGNAGLEELHKLFGIDTLEYINGTINTVINMEGKLPGISEINLKNMVWLNKNCTINVAGTDFRMSGGIFDFKNINGEILVTDKVNFRNFSFNLDENNFVISGGFKNLFEFIFLNDKYLSFDVDVNSSLVNPEGIISGQQNNEGKKKKQGKLSSDNIYFNTDLSLDRFVFRKFIADNVSGMIVYSPEAITFKAFRFDSFEGIIKGDGTIFRQKDDFVVQCNSELESIDIKKLFYSFNNFGQEFILDNNLDGELSGIINFSARWDNKYNLISESVNADCNINIENGELIDFEPLNGLSKFIALEELKRVKFKNLKNEILIKDKTVIIPEMDIYSSAFNISALGIHKFDNSYDYRITVSLSDLLFKKAKKKKQEISEYIIIEDDGAGKISIPLRFTGKDNNYKSSFDKKSAMDALKHNIAEEKKTIKSIIKEEFRVSDRNDDKEKDLPGDKDVNISWEDQNNKKDVIFESRDGEDENPEFIIHWDEDEDTSANTDE